MGELWESLGKWSLSEEWSPTQELWRLTLIFNGMFLNEPKSAAGWAVPALLVPEGWAPAAPGVTGILLHEKFILTEPHTGLGHPLVLPYVRKSCFLQLVGPGLVVVVGTHSISPPSTAHT